MTNDDRYEPFRAVAAEGARVGLLTCRLCGVVLLLDEATSFDVAQRHDEWHASLMQNGGAA